MLVHGRRRGRWWCILGLRLLRLWRRRIGAWQSVSSRIRAVNWRSFSSNLGFQLQEELCQRKS